MVFCPERALGIQPGFIPEPRHRLEVAMLCYIALRSVERFVEMLPEGRSSARPPLPRDGVSVA